ncbi:MAG: LysE family translocator, partial [Beijerinckiaceae bacterium]|nr:LysE family translocator [Beijerinckiaceae bacterium]
MTPGPNNVMLLASGVNYGFARTLPHVAGVVGGYGFLLLVLGAGLGNLFTAVPAAHMGLKIAGGLYLIWLAWKIATGGPAQASAGGGQPLTFLQAALFQWVNVKGVLVAISAVAAFTRPDALAGTLSALIVVAMLACGLSALTWAMFGSVLSRWLANPRVLRPFNIVMALLLVASLWP